MGSFTSRSQTEIHVQQAAAEWGAREGDGRPSRGAASARSVGLTNTLAGGGSSAAAFGPCLRRAGRPQRHSQSRQHHYGEPAGLGASLRIALKSGERLMRGVTKIYLCNVAEPPANGGIKAVTKNGINKKTHKQRWTFEWSSTTTPMSPCRECVSSCIVPRPKDLHTRVQKTTCFYDCQRATTKAGGKAYI